MYVERLKLKNNLNYENTYENLSLKNPIFFFEKTITNDMLANTHIVIHINLFTYTVIQINLKRFCLHFSKKRY